MNEWDVLVISDVPRRFVREQPHSGLARHNAPVTGAACAPSQRPLAAPRGWYDGNDQTVHASRRGA